MTKHDEYLRYLTLIGAEKRLDPDERETWEARIDHELGIIAEAGFASYFLIVHALIQFCIDKKIAVGPGRGSVCGSLVTYCLHITDVDPITWDIPFERFLHLERISMPDIDLDICKDRRGEVVDYIKDTYGKEAVAQIITYGTIQAKAAVRRACKDLEVEKTITGQFSMKIADELSSAVPDGTGADQTILVDWIKKKGDSEVDRFNKLVKKYGKQYSKALNRKGVDEKFLLNTILYLEGRRAHGSVHSAGLVIGSGNLVELGIPIGRRNAKSKRHSDYDMKDAEVAGLLKLDILGLRTVTLIDQTVKFIKNNKDPDFDIKSLPLDDEKTFAMLRTGSDNKGIFQLSKDSISNAMKGIRPSEFEDIITILALYRPGPMEQLGSYARRKLGEEKVDYAHPDLEPALSKTYGLIVYQEQVMAIAQIMADYTPGEADIFRKAIGKKIPKLIAEEIAKFTQRAVKKGYNSETIEELGKQISFFGRYGFNRGHATGYAYLTYWTAYLKCRYPVEFYAAIFSSYVGDSEKIALFGSDCLAANIKLLTPNINASIGSFTPEASGIRFGFNGIKGLGDAAVDDIVEYRDSKECWIHTRETVERTRPIEGSDKLKKYKASIKKSDRGKNDPRPYLDFSDFCNRLTGIPINTKQAMIAAGCFDDGDLEFRAKLYVMAPELNKEAKKTNPKSVDEPIDWPDEVTMLDMEKDVLGSYVSRHPLEPHRNLLKMLNVKSSGLFKKLRIGKSIRLAGMVMKVRDHVDKKGGKMAWLTVESDWIGISEVMVFASVWRGLSVKVGDLVIIDGKKTDSIKFGTGFQAEGVSVVDPLRMRAKSVLLTIPDVDPVDIVWIQKNLTGTGARISILVDVGDNRLALVRTKSSITTTVHALEQFQSRGWGVRLNCGMGAINEYDNRSIRRTDQNFQGRGTKRLATWELPSAKLLTKYLGGKVIAEYTFD